MCFSRVLENYVFKTKAVSIQSSDQGLFSLQWMIVVVFGDLATDIRPKFQPDLVIS